MDSLIGDDYPFWLVIFPEGTTIHKEYVAKSQAFAEKYVKALSSVVGSYDADNFIFCLPG